MSGIGFKASVPEDDKYLIGTMSNTVTEEGFAADARQFNPDIEGSFAKEMVKTVREDETILWSGAQTAAGTITLSESIQNFKKLKIYIMSNSGQYREVKSIDVRDITVNATSASASIHLINCISSTTYYFSFQIWFPSNISITTFAPNTAGFTGPTLYKVVGVK